jgi:hypothetical protein
MALTLDIGLKLGVKNIPLGAKLKPSELPEGEYLVTNEGEFMVEEDNENNYLIQEPIA